MNKFKKIERNEIVWISGILVLGFVLRLYLFYLHDVIDYDGVYYAMLGKNLFSGFGYTEPEGIYQWYYPPLYPVSIGLLWYIFGNLEFASKIISLFCGVLSISLVYFITRKIYGKQAAVISGALTALHPSLIRFSSTDTAESQFICLLLLAILLTLYAVESASTLKFFLIGGVYGLLFLSKPAGVQYFTFYVAFLILAGLIMKWDKKTIFKRTTAVIICFLLFAFPYLLFLKKHYGYWTLSELTTRNLVRSLMLNAGDSPFKEYQLNSDGTRLKYFTSSDYHAEHISLLKLFREDRGTFIRRYGSNLKQEIFFSIKEINILAVAVLVLFFSSFRRRMWRPKVCDELLLASILLPLFTAPLISSHSLRWILPFIPVLIIWSSEGILILQNKFTDWIGKSFGLTRHTAIIVIFFWMTTVTFPFIAESKLYALSYPYEHKEMGLKISGSKMSPDTIIMSVSPHVSFYTGTRVKIMPWGTYSEILKYARHHDVDLIVIDETFIPKRPQMTFLLNEDSAPPELQLTYKLTAKNNKKILVYKLLKAKT